jgi:hypothetical protein
MALTVGVNCGFVPVAPTADPAATTFPNFDNTMGAFKAVAPQGATRIVELGWYCDNATQAANWEGGVFADAGAGEPEGRLQHSPTNAKGTTAGWKATAPIVWTGIVPGTAYWFGLQLDPTATRTAVNGELSGGPGFATKAAPQTTLPSDWGTSSTTDADGIVGIYAIYRTSKLLKRRRR